MVKLLIDRGANVKAICDTHHTPLLWASNKETAELLIDAGADVNAKTLSKGETILYSSARNAAQGAPKSYQMYLGLVKLLIAKGADVNVKLKTGETTLHRVAFTTFHGVVSAIHKVVSVIHGVVSAIHGHHLPKPWGVLAV